MVVRLGINESRELKKSVNLGVHQRACQNFVLAKMAAKCNFATHAGAFTFFLCYSLAMA